MSQNLSKRNINLPMPIGADLGKLLGLLIAHYTRNIGAAQYNDEQHQQNIGAAQASKLHTSRRLCWLQSTRSLDVETSPTHLFFWMLDVLLKVTRPNRFPDRTSNKRARPRPMPYGKESCQIYDWQSYNHTGVAWQLPRPKSRRESMGTDKEETS